MDFAPVVFPRALFSFFRLGRLLLVAAVCLSLGAHWVALQTVAWTGMIVTYSQFMGLGEAVATTFSGEHPCGLCKAVESGQQQEKKSGGLLMVKKCDAVLISAQAWRPRFAAVGEVRAAHEFAPAFRAPPITPPPRG